MKRNIVKLLVLFGCIHSFLYSQSIDSAKILASGEPILKESIYVHSNATFLLTGEKLYYQLYCVNSSTRKISKFSKIAYVELVGKNNNIVFKHRIRLQSGIGQGDFFIPTNVVSGSYKLIAYTQWMLNGTTKDFFQQDIAIINPYQNNSISQDSSNEIEKIETLPLSEMNSQNSLIKLDTDAELFSKRSEVKLHILSLLADKSFGNYSISVRRIDSLNSPERVSTTNYNFNASDYNLVHLPELRGELISGQISASNAEQSVLNKKVALTIADSNPIFKMANTNERGEFYFNLENEYSNSEAFVQVLDYKKDDFTIAFDRPASIEYRDLTFDGFSVHSNLEDVLSERSIHIQIENAYNSVKSDSIIDLESIPPFYETSNILEYNLDDYTRFPTVRETFIEVIDKAWLVKANGQYEFRIRANDDRTISPIVLIDGFLIQNQNEIIDFNAKKIQKIRIVRDEYIYGSEKFGGIISITTKNQDFINDVSINYISKHNLFKSERNKRYFNPNYLNRNRLARIPDFRTQLLWLPNLELKKKEMTISFYTSDNPGTYEIQLEGFSEDGNPSSLTKIITVQ